mgnify:CR=1 FL=1
MSDLAYTFPVTVDPNDVMIDFILGLEIPGLTAANVSIDLPETSLMDRLPYVLVGHWGGESDRFGMRPDVDLSVFDNRYPKARDLARLIEARLLGYPFRVSSGGRSVLVDKVEAPVPTVEVEWQKDSTIRRFQGTYSLSIRR